MGKRGFGGASASLTPVPVVGAAGGWGARLWPDSATGVGGAGTGAGPHPVPTMQMANKAEPRDTPVRYLNPQRGSKHCYHVVGLETPAMIC